jgi:hypothetical protein
VRYFPLLVSGLAIGVIALLVPAAHAREVQDLREQVRDGVQRTDKDLGDFVHRDKLDQQQRDRFDAAIKDLHELGDAVADGKWQGERGRLERTVENIEFLQKHAPIEEGDRQVLGIDLNTLRVILEHWKP